MYYNNKLSNLRSAMQKSIRWCEVNDSRYFAREIMNLGYPGGVFNRLMIIAAEDVGLADPSLLLYERARYGEFQNRLKQDGLKKRDASNFPPDVREIVDRAVIAAALSYKSKLLPMATFATLFNIYQNETFNENLSEYVKRFIEAIETRDEKETLIQT